jgi:two-component system, chemotaxis family, protein-glutamate methylesterase/glutaminase
VATRVLVVDDSPFICKLISLMLEERGEFTVVGMAHDGAEALTAVERLHPDLVTLDLDMPGMGGAEMLEHLRQRSKIPVVIVSGMPEQLAPGAIHPEWAPLGYVAKVLSDRPLDLSLFAAELAEAIRDTCAQVLLGSEERSAT